MADAGVRGHTLSISNPILTLPAGEADQTLRRASRQENMIIDRVSEEFSGLLDLDTDVMTSPVHLWSFYGCSSPTEPNLCAGSPNSDSDQSWSDAGSPRNSANERKRSPYQGVRVKNTVKELILQKRHHDIQAQQYQFESEYPAVTHLLQGEKRQAESPSHYPAKRVRVTDGNILSACVRGENSLYDTEMLEDIGEVLSIESVSVSGCPARVCRESLSEAESVCRESLSEAESVCGPARGQESLLGLFAESESVCRESLLPLYTSCSYTHSIPARTHHVTPVVPVSFFQWQIQQEEQKLAALSPVELSARDGDGDTFLHIAVAQGRRALAYVLARKMAAIDMLDMKEHNQQSAFQVSVAADQHLIAQDLLSLGAEINTLDCWGRSPLHVCAEKGHAPTLQAIQRSVQTSGRALDVEVVNYDGLTPLHVAVLSHNAAVQEQCVSQSPALQQKRKMLSECIGTLMLMGASLETKDRKSGRTAVHMAAEEANVELLRLFLDQPSYLAIINAKAFSGNTALHMASALQGRQAQVEAVRLLMRRGADPSAKNLENEQPAQLVPEGPLGEQFPLTLFLLFSTVSTHPVPQFPLTLFLLFSTVSTHPVPQFPLTLFLLFSTVSTHPVPPLLHSPCSSSSPPFPLTLFLLFSTVYTDPVPPLLHSPCSSSSPPFTLTLSLLFSTVYTHPVPPLLYSPCSSSSPPFTLTLFLLFSTHPVPPLLHPVPSLLHSPCSSSSPLTLFLLFSTLFLLFSTHPVPPLLHSPCSSSSPLTLFLLFSTLFLLFSTHPVPPLLHPVPPLLHSTCSSSSPPCSSSSPLTLFLLFSTLFLLFSTHPVLPLLHSPCSSSSPLTLFLLFSTHPVPPLLHPVPPLLHSTCSSSSPLTVPPLLHSPFLLFSTLFLLFSAHPVPPLLHSPFLLFSSFTHPVPPLLQFPLTLFLLFSTHPVPPLLHRFNSPCSSSSPPFTLTLFLLFSTHPVPPLLHRLHSHCSSSSPPFTLTLFLLFSTHPFPPLLHPVPPLLHSPFSSSSPPCSSSSPLTLFLLFSTLFLLLHSPCSSSSPPCSSSSPQFHSPCSSFSTLFLLFSAHPVPPLLHSPCSSSSPLTLFLLFSTHPVPLLLHSPCSSSSPQFHSPCSSSSPQVRRILKGKGVQSRS
ncbi:unnamed protein product [Leuciscus chuanchicus]